MNYRKIVSGALAVLISVTAVAGSVTGCSQKNAAVIPDRNDENYTVSSSNSIGRYISNLAMQEKDEKEQVVEAQYSICDASYDCETSTVTLKTKQSGECVLNINILTDDENKELIKTYKTALQATGEESSVKIDKGELPEYFVIEAVLADTCGGKLSKEFYINDNTRMVREIKEATVNDFAEEQVVNFDESEDTNFVVLSEDTVIAETTEDSNKLVKADYEAGEFVFENADEKITEMKEGDFFYIQPDDENMIAISVASVEERDEKQ